MNYLKLAWRNIWRNKRRTFITIASVLFALFFALIMRSMQLGTYARMTDNIVQSYTGYIQIHKNGYWNDKDINNTLLCNDDLLDTISKIENVSMVVPRLESFALASSGQQTKGVLLIGTDPEKENELTQLAKKVTAGSYIKKYDDGVMVAEKLADYLHIKVNDTLVLIGQGFHGVSAAGKYPVKCILHFSSPDLNSQMVYSGLQTCQEFYSAQNRVTSISLNIKDKDRIDETYGTIKKTLNKSKYEVMKWDELLVELVQYIKLDNISGLIYLFILYMVIAFGVFGTVLMMTTERIKEFGVMTAIGMQKFKLSAIVILEMLLLGIIGIASGIIISLPIIIYYYNHPIWLGGKLEEVYAVYGFEPLLCFSIDYSYFINQSIVVMIIVLLAIIFPVVRIGKLNIINALRSK
jgi:ABC-type lipoprotein release transport system permease subunit